VPVHRLRLDPTGGRAIVAEEPVVTRSDSRLKLEGRAVYGTDLDEPGMLWAVLVLSPVAHGRIRQIDLSTARRMPGVVAVVGAQEARDLLPPSASGQLFPEPEVTYQSQPIAAVAAETLGEARAAARAVVSHIDPLPTVTDIEELFPDWPGEEVKDSPHVVGHVHARHGDLDAAFHEADLVHSETYRTSGVQQVALEPHACLAWVTDGTYHVKSSTQSPFGVREGLAEVLGIPEEKIVVEPTWIGGGFGGKGAAMLEPFALLLAQASHRPVRLALTYREEFLLGRSTLPSVVRYETAIKRGIVTARRIRLLLDCGDSLPGNDFTVGYAIGFLLGPYRTPAVELEGYAIRTNKSPFGPHRAPFAPQCAFMAESHLDSIAHRLGVDPIEFRLQNAWREGDETALGQTVTSFGLTAALERAREIALAWRRTKAPDEGIGIGVGFWSTGTGAGGEARLTLSTSGLVIEQGEGEIGTGSIVRGLSAVAERVLGLPASMIEVRTLDTAHAPFDSGVFGSRTVAALGQAVEKAAEAILSRLGERMGTRAAITLHASNGKMVVRSGRIRRSLDELYTPEERAAGGIVADGRHYGTSGKIDDTRVLEGTFYPYTDFTAVVHVVHAAVDRETGAVTVRRLAALVDVGKVLDPVMFRGQVEGAVVMGLGEALTEETSWEAGTGRLLNPKLLDYRIPTLGEIPPIDVIPIEGFRGAGPFGLKGLGEPPIIPTIAAVANAVADATGARVMESPLTAERVARALKLL
jgi:CO/xanthine dehydrogenase Mo-binding subunit